MQVHLSGSRRTDVADGTSRKYDPRFDPKPAPSYARGDSPADPILESANRAVHPMVRDPELLAVGEMRALDMGDYVYDAFIRFPVLPNVSGVGTYITASSRRMSVARPDQETYGNQRLVQLD